MAAVTTGKTDSQPETASPPLYAIEALSLVKQFSRATALDHFSLHVQSGEFFGLLGPNGAGKTTTISILTDRLRADQGTLSILGLSYGGNRRHIKKHIGLVPQEIALYETLTARENLSFFGKCYGCRGQQLKERVQRGLVFAGLTDRSNRLVRTFSGGMKRRLNLAAGLLHDPQVLFLDEPTVGIDTQSRHLIHRQLIELNRAGMTIIYTTHYMEDAMELCSRIGIMDKGKLLQAGKPADLLEQNQCTNLEELFLQLTGKTLRDT